MEHFLDAVLLVLGATFAAGFALVLIPVGVVVGAVMVFLAFWIVAIPIAGICKAIAWSAGKIKYVLATKETI